MILSQAYNFSGPPGGPGEIFFRSRTRPLINIFVILTLTTCGKNDVTLMDVVCAEDLSCTPKATTTVQSGDKAEMECRMAYSGNRRPTMKWFTSDDEELESVDKFEAADAGRSVTRTVTGDDDRRPFRCVATFGDIQRVCQVVIQVPRKSWSRVLHAAPFRNYWGGSFYRAMHV